MVNEFKILKPFKFQSLNKSHYMKYHVVRNAPQINKGIKLKIYLKEKMNPNISKFTSNVE